MYNLLCTFDTWVNLISSASCSQDPILIFLLLLLWGCSCYRRYDSKNTSHSKRQSCFFLWVITFNGSSEMKYFCRVIALRFFVAPLRRAPVFVLGMSACRYVTVLYASLPFMVELNPRMWNVPLPNLEFLLEDLCWKWTDRESSATSSLCEVYMHLQQPFQPWDCLLLS